MTVKRIVLNIASQDLAPASIFYGEILGLEQLMDLGWIQTFGSNSSTAPQVSIASEGGSNTPVPDMSIEVDNFEEVHQRCVEHDFAIVYGPVDEPWGVRRFYVRDPFGKLVNIVTHK